MQKIEIIQTFNQPVEKVFKDLSDHASFGRIIGANIQRINTVMMRIKTAWDR